jgi:hypothetical protein
MMRTVAVLTVLGFATPALAEVPATPAPLSDSELDQVTAGGDMGAPTTTTNINISPIVVTQTAVALSYQSAWTHPGKGNGKGKGKAKGLGHFKQNATTTAFNYAVINYNVTF